MARISNITFGQVAQIADAMKAAGTRPTARAVRERIGSGSMGTIHKFLQQWTGKTAEQDDDTETAELPSHIQTALMDFIGTEIATACEPLNEELQEARSALDDIAQDNERMHRSYEQQSEDLDRANEERAAAMAQLNLTRETLDKANNKLTELAKQNSELTRELDRAQRQIEILASLQHDLATTKAALEECSRARIDAEKNAAILAAQLDAAKQRNTDLCERLELTEKRATSNEAEMKQANIHYQACAARLEAAAREIDALRNQKSKTTPPKAPAKPQKPKPTNVNMKEGQ